MMRRYRLCQHTKDDGELCGSPAMRRRSYCYFHLEVVRRRRRLARMARTRRLLAEAKRYDDRISALNSYGMNLLGHYSRANSEVSDICEDEAGGGGGGDPSADRIDCSASQRAEDFAEAIP